MVIVGGQKKLTVVVGVNGMVVLGVLVVELVLVLPEFVVVGVVMVVAVVVLVPGTVDDVEVLVVVVVDDDVPPGSLPRPSPCPPGPPRSVPGP